MMDKSKETVDAHCTENVTNETAKLQPGTENMENSKGEQEPCAYNVEENTVEQNLVPNVTTPADKSPQNYWKKKGATSMAAFLFWTNLAAVVLLLIGFVTPGWLTINVRQILHYSKYSSYGSGDRVTYTDVFQDYSLWYITQCYDLGGTSFKCQTRTYRTIEGLHERICESYDCRKIEIGSLEITDKSSVLYFFDAALVFSYSELVRSQALYTVGLLLSCATLYVWCKFRRGVADEKCLGFSNKKWLLLFLFGVLSALFVLIPVFMYAAVSGKIGNDFTGDVKSPLGVVFGGFGGAMLVVCYTGVLMHLICCRSEKDFYICTNSPVDERALQALQEDEEDV